MFLKESVVELQDNGFFPAPLTSQKEKSISISREQLVKEDRIPLTDAQKEIWVASLMSDTASCTFNESSYFIFKGKLNKDALEKAFTKVIERHEALRITISYDGQYQIVHNDSSFKLIFSDPSKIDELEKNKIITDKINSESRKVFNLTEGPLIRAELIKLNEEDHRLIITTHHIICDGWSYDVMVKDLGRIYSEEVEQKFTEPKIPMQMREFVTFLEESKKTTEYKEQENYWLKRLASPRSESELPTDFPRPEVRTFNGARITGQINSSLFKQIKDLSAKSGNTLFVTFLSVFSILLNKLTQDEDVITGIPAAGQQIVGANDLVGHCTNLLPIRFNVDPKLNFNDYLKQVKSLVLDAYDNQQVTYGDIIAKLKIKRSSARTPLLSTMFNIDPAIIGLKFSGLESEFLANPISGYQFEFGFNLVNYNDECLIECDYNTDLFTANTIGNYINYYNNILEQIVEFIEKPLNEIQILSKSEIQKLINL